MAFDIAMCDPNHYTIEYSINPWMKTNVKLGQEGDAYAQARTQWQQLYDALSAMVDVDVCESQPRMPDMVFFGNAGLLIGNTYIPPRFTYPERQGEEQYLKAWAKQRRLEIVELSKSCRFEGEADALVDTYRKIIWGGSEFRTTCNAHRELSKIFDIPAISLTMTNEYFYHLDTCLSPLFNGVLLYYPHAFDKHSQEAIESEVSKEMRIPVSDEDAQYFACNVVQVKNTVFVNNASEYLSAQLKEHNIQVQRIPLDEFLKAGGGAKCLTLTRYVL